MAKILKNVEYSHKACSPEVPTITIWSSACVRKRQRPTADVPPFAGRDNKHSAAFRLPPESKIIPVRQFRFTTETKTTARRRSGCRRNGQSSVFHTSGAGLTGTLFKGVTLRKKNKKKTIRFY
ncbi:hypothetical protein [Limibacterium fermenti]|uniref:hypothetical protein n=1 Tax=Limibacterium fermenti TaxID=3229863 RepID=UPI000E938730|nr:hypothetical protein [Porphyromonadaceae bacterium]